MRKTVDKFTIEFYEKENGEIPAEEFLLSLDKKMRAKFIKKTQKTPKSEINKAKLYRNNYLERCEKNEKI